MKSHGGDKPPAHHRPTRRTLSHRSSNHYQTFPTAPPKTRGRPPSSPSSSTLQYDGDGYHHGGGGGGGGGGSYTGEGDSGRGVDGHGHGHGHHDGDSPLPMRQLAVLAFIALAEQTALNSISPYLPEMTSTFPGVERARVGLYVGLIASSFALAQFATNFFWGWASDRVGRKPVVLLGTLCTAAAFVAFGFCRTLGQAVAVQVLMGLLNGNQGVVSTCLGEITDRSNQSRAFVYLPVVYGIGGITGPALGGLLVREDHVYPYLLPNLFAAGVLFIDLILTGLFLDESLEEAKDLPPLRRRVGSLFTWIWQFAAGSRHPTYLDRHGHHHHHHHHHVRASATEGDDERASLLSSASSATSSVLDAIPGFTTHNEEHLSSSAILNRDTLLLLGTYLIFQLSNISFNSLYPIFASAEPPTGRGLSPEEIGLLLSFAGIVTIVFQVGVFGRLKARMGNKATYRAGLLLFGISMWLMPWVGYREAAEAAPGGLGLTPKVWLWIEMGSILLLKTVASVGGLTSALLLITNTAPTHGVLGTLNGLAQTLSAAGRAAGPFLSGGLFSVSTRIRRPKGELLAWGVFGGIAFLGWALSWGIRGRELESGSWNGDEHEVDEGSEVGSRVNGEAANARREAGGMDGGADAVDVDRAVDDEVHAQGRAHTSPHR